MLFHRRDIPIFGLIERKPCPFRARKPLMDRVNPFSTFDRSGQMGTVCSDLRIRLRTV